MAEHAHDAHDHHPGGQDIHEQLYTYNLFGKLTKWGSLALAVSILVLTLWFCTDAGFLGGLIPGLVVLAVGIAVMRERRPAAH